MPLLLVVLALAVAMLFLITAPPRVFSSPNDDEDEGAAPKKASHAVIDSTAMHRREKTQRMVCAVSVWRGGRRG